MIFYIVFFLIVISFVVGFLKTKTPEENSFEADEKEVIENENQEEYLNEKELNDLFLENKKQNIVIPFIKIRNPQDKAYFRAILFENGIHSYSNVQRNNDPIIHVQNFNVLRDSEIFIYNKDKYDAKGIAIDFIEEIKNQIDVGNIKTRSDRSFILLNGACNDSTNITRSIPELLI